MSEQFFLTLSSASMCEFQATNKTSKFKVHLGRVLQLNGLWEVCLFEIFYPATLHNLRKNACTVHSERTSFDRETGDFGFTGDRGFSITNLESKAYASEKALVEEINAKCQPAVNIEFNKNKMVTVKIISTLTNDEIEIVKLGHDLRRILGLRPEPKDVGGLYLDASGSVSVEKSECSADVRRGLTNTLTVTTNIITDQIINNTQAKILRTFQIEHNTYENGFIRKVDFPKLIFLPVAVKKIECIEINILDDKNEFASFVHGHLTVVLLFKKVGHE